MMWHLVKHMNKFTFPFILTGGVVGGPEEECFWDSQIKRE